MAYELAGRFPVEISYGSSGGPRFSTAITETGGGYERRNANWSQARCVFDAATGVRALADEEGGEAGLDAASRGLGRLIAHFRACYGRLMPFPYKDWSDYSSAPDGVSEPEPTDQHLGTSDGAQAVYPLVKRYRADDLTHDIGGDAPVYEHVREIALPLLGTLTVALDGRRLDGGWHWDREQRAVVLDVAPEPGVQVTAGFEFDVPCRYDADTLSVKLDDYMVGSASVAIIEDRL